MASRTQTSEEVLIEMSYPLEQFTEDEAHETFDKNARFYLGMSGNEFLQRWDAGEWQDDIDQPGVISMYMLMPLVRPNFPDQG